MFEPRLSPSTLGQPAIDQAHRLVDRGQRHLGEMVNDLDVAPITEWDHAAIPATDDQPAKRLA